MFCTVQSLRVIAVVALPHARGIINLILPKIKTKKKGHVKRIRKKELSLGSNLR